MAYLREHGLDQVIGSLTQPVLGICVGLQLMCRAISEESDVDCMGILTSRYFASNPAGEKFKLPIWMEHPARGQRTSLFRIAKMPMSNLYIPITPQPGTHLCHYHVYPSLQCGPYAVTISMRFIPPGKKRSCRCKNLQNFLASSHKP
jgi:hypothetical protein